MTVQVQMPALGESVTEGTITQWLKKEGDSVEEGEGLLEVSTDKVDTEIPSPASGVLQKIVAGEDETVPVGGDLAVIEDGVPPAEAAAHSITAIPGTSSASPLQTTVAPSIPSGAPHEPHSVAPAVDGPDAETRPHPAKGDVPSGTEPADGLYVTPIVRTVARDRGVDLATVTGTGPGGRISRADVLSAAGETWTPAPARPAPASPVATRVAHTAQRPSGATTPAGVRTIAPVATFGLQEEVDVTGLMSVLARVGPEVAARHNADTTVATFVLKAAVEALKAIPALNGGDSTSVHLGLVTDNGTDVLEGADGLNLAGIARRAARLPATTVAPTFLITGAAQHLGLRVDVPALDAGVVAALGIGAVLRSPRVLTSSDGTESLGVRSVCHLALTVDGARADRAAAGRFLTAVRARLEDGRIDADLTR